VSKYLWRGADPRYRDDAGIPVLHLAAAADKPVVIRQIMKTGGEVNAVCDSGDTALHLAAMMGGVEVVQELLKARANPFALDINDMLPVEIAELNDNKAVHKMLRLAMDRIKNSGSRGGSSKPGKSDLMVA